MVVQTELSRDPGPQPVRLPWRAILPPLCPYYVPRPRLHELLNRRPEGRLTLMVAPAGFGKTTLLKAWTQDAPARVAWLSPPAAECHLRAFMHAVMTAVQAVIPRFGDGVLTLLLMEPTPSTDVLALAIARELTDLPHDLTLVIDGYESIADTAVHQLLSTLIEQIPAHVHVVVASRTMPPLHLARLRARGQLTEIGPDELRFQTNEAEALFAGFEDGAQPGLVASALNDRVGGWPSLLGLVAQRLQQQAEMDVRTDTPGHHEERSTSDDTLRHLSDRDVEAFLIEEVLEAQTPDVQQLLLRTSLLDAFNAELCDALLQPESLVSGSNVVLDRLDRHLLLVGSVDESGTWYRCPGVLRHVLRRRLQYAVTPLELEMLRRRASQWLAEHGMMDEAIEQARACEDVTEIAELIERDVASLLTRREFPAIEQRLRLLPTDVMARRPRLILARAWLMNFLTRFAAIPTVLASLDAALELNEQGLRPAEIEQLQAEAAVLRAVVATIAGDGERILALTRPAFNVIPRFSGHASAFAAGYLGIGLHLVGETGSAIAFLEGVCREAPEPADLDCVVARWALAWIGIMAARPRDAVRWAGQLLQADAGVPKLGVAWGHLLRGLAHYELNQLSGARDDLVAADRLRGDAHRLTFRNALIGLALVEQASGDFVAASDALHELGEAPDIADSPSHRAVVGAFQAHLAASLGGVDTVREILVEAGGESAPVTVESISGSPSLIRARGLIALGGDDDRAEAARILDTLESAAASVNDQLQAIGALAVRALLCQSRGEAEGALRFLEQAVASAAPHGLVRTFVDLGPPMQWLITELDRRSTSFRPYLAHLLEAFPSSEEQSQQPTQVRSGSRLGPELAESLTWREIEVLRLLDARLSNQEIAGVLLISAETVKKHTSNIYQKLHVSGRRQAVSRSYALGILPATSPATPSAPAAPRALFLDRRQA